ncbi:MAG: hypothetical protein Q9220_004720 [cf. Caloplaca sp. 1 TL-2023]
MEAIAIIGCIAAVVSAYRDGGAIVNKIKQKRLARQAPPPTRLLEESLARGPTAVEEAKENGIERFGSKYAAGDKLALDSLKDILIDLQGSLIKHLRRAQEDDNMADFTTLVDASDIGRIRTVTVLNELYMRVAMSATITQVPFGEMGSFTNHHTANPDGQMTSNILSHASASPPSIAADSNVSQRSTHLAPSLKQAQFQLTPPPEDPAERRTTPKSGFFDKFRRKSSSEDGSSKSTNRRSSNIRSKEEMISRSSRQSQKLSPSQMASPQASIDEDNPWATESTGQVPTPISQPTDTSFSRATTLVPGMVKRPSASSRTSSSSTPATRMLSPYEIHGGFCKGAYKLQVNEKDAMKVRNQSVAKTGEDYYWACCSSKCAFEGPALQKGKEWAFENTVRESHGIRYRWSFLAKAHVTIPKVKNGKYDYGCVFCIYDGIACPVFHGIREFMQHVETHRGKSLAEAMLQRVKCINDRVAQPEEDFDINLTPVEALPTPISFKDTSQTLQSNIMMSAASSERMSWGTSEDTMADVDPWRDAT